jgi:hypothetical protein
MHRTPENRDPDDKRIEVLYLRMDILNPCGLLLKKRRDIKDPVAPSIPGVSGLFFHAHQYP